jgi:SAM-dependent methyltransferase
MSLPPGVASYGDPAYWEARFAGGEEGFEWCGGGWAGGVGDALCPALAGAVRVLVLGAGTSRLPFELASEGVGGAGGRLPALREVVATDLSPTAVENMRARAAAAATPPGGAALTFAVADMLDLAPFGDASFDAVIEKGTFDVLEVAGTDGRAPDPWDPPNEVRARMHRALGEAHRVLRPGGGLLASITWAPPLFRRGHYLDDPRYDWGGPERVVGGVGGAVPVLAYTLRRGARGAEARWARRPPGEVTGAGAGGGGMPGLPAAPEHAGMDEEGYLLRVGLGDESE